MDPLTFLLVLIALGIAGFLAFSRAGLFKTPVEHSRPQHPILQARRKPKPQSYFQFEMGGELELKATSPTEHPVHPPAISLPQGEVLTSAPPSDKPELPSRYGDNRIVALIRDPYWVFAYWEINQEKKAEIAHKYGEQIWEKSWQVLRVYDLTEGKTKEVYFDIPVGDTADSWHIPVGTPNRTFCIERGMILPDGRYVPLACSNVVTTPSDHVSDLVDEEWMLLRDLDRKLYRRLAQLPLGASSPQFAYSLHLTEEIARRSRAVSSPLLPRTQREEELSRRRGEKRQRREAGFIPRNEWKSALLPQKAAIPQQDKTAKLEIALPSAFELTQGGMAAAEKMCSSAEEKYQYQKIEREESTLLVAPSERPEMLYVNLEEIEARDNQEIWEKQRRQ